MEEKKLTDEEVIKALSHCSGVKPVCDENCPAYNLQNEINCQDYMNRLALDLIHRQKAEIERLTEELEVKKKECREIADDYQEMGTFYYNETIKTAELQKQVDKLKKERENVQKILYELGKCGNDEERYAAWVKLIKYCGVEVE